MEIPNRRLSAERGKRRQRTPPGALIRQVKKEPNELKRKMLLVGYLSDELSKRGAFVFLVGGQAVETYTAGQFTTGDIDITTTAGNTGRTLEREPPQTEEDAPATSWRTNDSWPT